MNGEKINYKYTVCVIQRVNGYKVDEFDVITFALNEKHAKQIAEVVKEEIETFKGTKCDYCIKSIDTTI